VPSSSFLAAAAKQEFKAAIASLRSSSVAVGDLATQPASMKASAHAAMMRTAKPLSRPAKWLIFEDAHWNDPTSIEALNAVIENVQRARVLAVITYRPEFKLIYRRGTAPEAGHMYANGKGVPQNYAEAMKLN